MVPNYFFPDKTLFLIGFVNKKVEDIKELPGERKRTNSIVHAKDSCC